MKSKYINLILFVVFALAVLTLKFGFHELWKDEWQAWMVARDLGFADMIAFLNYEGHPALWYSYLKVWTWVGGADEFMLQLAHSLTIIVALYVLLIRFKMHWLFKLLIAASYFCFFEYGIVNRGYALVMLFSFLSVDALRSDSIKLFAASLFLLCQTEVYGVMIAGTLGFYYLIHSIDEKAGIIDHLRKLEKLPIIGLSIGILIFVIVVFPRGNTDDFTRAYIQQPFDMSLIKSSFQGIFANVFGLGIISDTKLFGVSGFGIFYSFVTMALSFMIFAKRRFLWMTWLFFVLGFFIFNIAIFNGGIRHLGMGFVMFVTLIELRDMRLSWLKPMTYSLLILLLPSVVHNIRAISEEITIPFSNAKAAGIYIKENIPSNVPVVAINKFETAPVGAYADRPLYEMPTGQSFTYFKWLEKVYIPVESELRLFAQFKKVGGIVILSPTPLDTDRFPSAQLGKSFDSKSMKRENYYFYTLAVR